MNVQEGSPEFFRKKIRLLSCKKTTHTVCIKYAYLHTFDIHPVCINIYIPSIIEVDSRAKNSNFKIFVLMISRLLLLLCIMHIHSRTKVPCRKVPLISPHPPNSKEPFPIFHDSMDNDIFENF